MTDREQADGTWSESQIEEVAEAVLRLLATEPYRSRLLDALGGGSGRGAAEVGPVSPAPREAPGPAPIGPYEVLPDFGDFAWDDPPPGTPRGEPSKPSASGPQVRRGSRPARPRREG